MAPPWVLFQGKFSGGGVIRDHCEQWMFGFLQHVKGGQKCGTRALGLKRWTFVNILVSIVDEPYLTSCVNALTIWRRIY
ncbi:hypothetical protein ACB092_05G265100 [Castanea dentata]